MFENLEELGYFIEDLAQQHQVDLHLGLEPEPFGHFENTSETLEFFERLHQASSSRSVISERIGLNYDTCHFAIEYDDAVESLETLRSAGIRLSKIHLSNALTVNQADPGGLEALRSFDEPTYFHQAIARSKSGALTRFQDLPMYLTAVSEGTFRPEAAEELRVHFHIPLDAEVTAPLGSTSRHVLETIKWSQQNPDACSHFEIETYTWAVLPQELQRPITKQIADEFRWVTKQIAKHA